LISAPSARSIARLLCAIETPVEPAYLIVIVFPEIFRTLNVLMTPAGTMQSAAPDALVRRSVPSCARSTGVSV